MTRRRAQQQGEQPPASLHEQREQAIVDQVELDRGRREAARAEFAARAASEEGSNPAAAVPSPPAAAAASAAAPAPNGNLLEDLTNRLSDLARNRAEVDHGSRPTPDTPTPRHPDQPPGHHAPTHRRHHHPPHCHHHHRRRRCQCPISFEPLHRYPCGRFLQPDGTAASKFMYVLEAAETWAASANTEPMTRAPIGSVLRIPNVLDDPEGW